MLTSAAGAWIAGGAVFAGLFAIGLGIASPLFVSASRRRARDIGAYVGSAAGDHRAKLGDVSPSAVSAQVLQLSDRLTRDRESTRKAAQLLERADLPVRANEWYVLRGVAVVVCAAGGGVLLRSSAVGTLIGLILGAVLGLIAPVVFLKVAASRRARKFERQLPDVMTLMASSLSTGFSLPQAVDAIVRDAPEPSAKEFARALAETRIGAEIEDSLDRIAHRMGSTNLLWTTMAVRIQRQVGGSLAETLRTTAATLRDRESLTRQVRALSAEGRLSSYILIGMPLGLFVYMLKVNHDYIALLWTTFLGILMSVAAVVSLLIGVFWMRKVVKVEA